MEIPAPLCSSIFGPLTDKRHLSANRGKWPHRLYERKRTLVLHREGGRSSLLETGLRLSATFDMIAPNASKPASFVPGPRDSPFQAVHQVALQPSSHLKARLFFPSGIFMQTTMKHGTFPFRHTSLLACQTRSLDERASSRSIPNPVVSFSRRAARKRVSPSHFLLGLQSLYLFPYRAAGL